MAKATRSKRDVEAEITAKVMEALERGTVPWEKPWRSAAGLLPTSVQTGRPYRGINVWLLTISAEVGGYASPYWLTFNQAKEFGGTVRKGEKGTLVVFWKRLEVKDPESPDVDGEPATKTIPMLRHYTVFNLEQTDDVTMPPRFQPDATEHEPVEPGEALDAIVAGYVDGPKIRHQAGAGASYSPFADVITLPALEQFDSSVAYSSALLHEMTHSTGHASRLNRFERNGEPQHFGTERYAREELVAEMGAAMLAAIGGIETRIEQNASYIKGWLSALDDDKTLVVRAAQQAQRAVDRITGDEVTA